MLQHRQTTATKPARVVILGAGGFVARDLVRLLRDQQIAHRAVGSSDINLLQGESVASLAALLRADDALVITSALTPEKGKDVATLMKNLSMIEHVTAALEKVSCAHVVYLSSDAVYAGRETLIREDSARQAGDLYGVMHIAREQMLTFAAAKTDTPLCIFCPCAIYGLGDTHNSYGPNRFLHSAVRERKIALFGAGEETRDHIYIEDVSRLLTLCLLRTSQGVINAVSGDASSFHHVATLIAELGGGDVQIESGPRRGPITNRHFDVTERIRAFPEFTPTPLVQGLAESFRRLTEAQRD